MEMLQKRINQVMKEKKWGQINLVRRTKEGGSKISQIVNGKVKDPRMSTLIKLADALDVSLDYLAGRTDSPMGFCDEELEDLRIDARARKLLRGFDLLPPEGKDAIQDQVDFQLSKNKKEVPDHRVCEVA